MGMTWLLSPKMWIGAAVGATLVGLWAITIHGPGEYRAGMAAMDAANKQATMEQLKERLKTNAKVRNMSDAELCRAIGGVWSQGECG